MMPANRASDRLQYLDGLRGVAALTVVYFHYFQRWPAYYPYDAVRVSPNVTCAWIGVWLFFVISGFVITLTLHRCANLYEFGLRRFARLWPAMLLCSVFTYLVLQVVPRSPFAVSARDFAPSLTFLDPQLFDLAFGGRPFDWMDGSYWSLFAEVQFYALIGCVYFLQPRRFARNLLIAAGAIMVCYAAAQPLGLERLFSVLELLSISRYLPFFLLGVGFYELHVGGRSRAFFIAGMLGIASHALIKEPAAQWPAGTAAISDVVCVLLLAWVGIRSRAGRHVLAYRWMTVVGAASYSLYLIHQRAGVALIHWLGERTHLSGVPALVLPIAVAIALTLLAVQIYRRWEAPLNRRIVALLGRAGRGRARRPVSPAAGS